MRIDNICSGKLRCRATIRQGYKNRGSNMNNKQELENMLARMEARIGALKKQLRDIPDGRLSLENRHGTPTYVITETVDGKRIRRSLNKDYYTVTQLLQAQLMRSEMEDLKHNADLIRKAALNYRHRDMSYLVDHLCEKWPDLNKWAVRDPLMSRQQAEWAKRPFVQSSKFPEGKKHTTRDGVKVRSKSELIIAEQLYDNGIPYHYEEEIIIGDIPFAPDFTIMRADGKLVYWEHMGLTGVTKYLSTQMYKIQMYVTADIVPWDNLIISFDDTNGHVDVREIDAFIKNRLII